MTSPEPSPWHNPLRETCYCQLPSFKSISAPLPLKAIFVAEATNPLCTSSSLQWCPQLIHKLKPFMFFFPHNNYLLLLPCSNFLLHFPNINFFFASLSNSFFQSCFSDFLLLAFPTGIFVDCCMHCVNPMSVVECFFFSYFYVRRMLPTYGWRGEDHSISLFSLSWWVG